MINLTTKDYEKKRRKGLKTNEGYIFENPKNRKKIIKVIEPDPKVPKYIEIKKYTIKLLLDNFDYLKELEWITIPEEGVSIDGIARGYLTTSLGLQKGKLLSCVLRDESISIDDKISCLKQIGTILRNMDALRNKYPHLSNLYYNDIHENNFMVTPRNEVYGIDFDSCSIADNVPIQGLYSMLLNRVQPKNNDKYPKCDQVCAHSTEIIPNQNLDLYSYTMIILNFMYGQTFHKWTPKELNQYLNYLDQYGANKEFLFIISYLFDETKDNVNPDYLLDYIKEMQPYSHKCDMELHYSRTLKR